MQSFDQKAIIKEARNWLYNRAVTERICSSFSLLAVESDTDSFLGTVSTRNACQYQECMSAPFMIASALQCTSRLETRERERERERDRSGDCRAGVSWWSHFKTVEFWEGSRDVALTVGFCSCEPIRILSCKTHITLRLVAPKSIWTFKPKMSACH